MTIVEFLEARIAEDEAGAETHVEPEKWCARAAAECAAKRALLTLFKSGVLFEVAAGGTTGWISPLTIMAIAYRDHPDYRQEWSL